MQIITNFHAFIWVFFSLLDPDPHSYCGSESGRKNECGSTRIRIHSPDRYLEFLKVSCNFMMRFFLQNQVRSDQGVLTKIRIGTAPRSPTTLPSTNTCLESVKDKQKWTQVFSCPATSIGVTFRSREYAAYYDFKRPCATTLLFGLPCSPSRYQHESAKKRASAHL